MAPYWKSRIIGLRPSPSMAVAVITVLLALGGVSFAGGKGIPTARVFNSTIQIVPPGTSTALTFDSESYDVRNLHDTASGTSRLTAPVAGVYAITATAEWEVGSPGDRIVALSLNGGPDYIAKSYIEEASRPSLNVATQYLLHVGDYIEVIVFQTSVGTLGVVGHVEMTLVAPASH